MESGEGSTSVKKNQSGRFPYPIHIGIGLTREPPAPKLTEVSRELLLPYPYRRRAAGEAPVMKRAGSYPSHECIKRGVAHKIRYIRIK